MSAQRAHVAYGLLVCIVKQIIIVMFINVYMDGCPLGLGLVVEDKPTEFHVCLQCSGMLLVDMVSIDIVILSFLASVIVVEVLGTWTCSICVFFRTAKLPMAKISDELG